MRKYTVWVGVDEEEVTFNDNATDKEIEEVCQEVLENMLGNIDSGWAENESFGVEKKPKISLLEFSKGLEAARGSVLVGPASDKKK